MNGWMDDNHQKNALIRGIEFPDQSSGEENPRSSPLIHKSVINAFRRLMRRIVAGEEITMAKSGSLLIRGLNSSRPGEFFCVERGDNQLVLPE